MKNQSKLIIGKLILLFLLFSSLSAQTTMFHSIPADKSQFGIQYLRPDFDFDFDMSTLSGIYDFSLNAPVTSNMNLVISVPYISFSFDRIDDENSIGNIYVGIQNRLRTDDKNNSALSLGLFIPTIPDDKMLIHMLGMFTNYHSIYKYTPDVLTIFANYAQHRSNANNFLFGFEIGPNICVPTEEDGGDTEIFMHYGFRMGMQSSTLIFFAELIGLAILTEEVDEFDDRFLHTVVFGGQWNDGRLKPGIFYKIYLKDDLQDFVDGVLGIKLDIGLK